MRLKDVFDKEDFIRTLFLGTALFLLFGVGFSLFMHAQYSAEINTVKNDLIGVKELMELKASKEYKQGNFDLSREYKEASIRAQALSKNVNAPPVSPSSMTYFHYWIASACFTKINLTPEQAGLAQNTVEALHALSAEPVLGAESWWAHAEFKGLLQQAPVLDPQFYTFYLFVFITAFATLYLGVKKKYGLDTIPYVIYGALMPVLFFGLLTLSGIITLTGLIKFYDVSQVSITTYVLTFIIMAVICGFTGLLVAQAKQK